MRVRGSGRARAAAARARLPDASRLRAAGRRGQQVLLLAGAVGVAVGLAVAGFEWLTAQVLLERVLSLPPAAAAAAPAAGLVLAAAALRWLGRRASPATTDEYIVNFHDPGRPLARRPVPARLAAAVASLGLGSSLGYEGPVLYLGAALGSSARSWLPRRLARLLPASERKILLVAGAAAGVAAIFKAPVTGLVFALEVPYREDLARHTLLPAAIAAASSYVTFAAFAGTAPLLPIAGQPPFDLVDLGGAALVGLAAGLLARLFVAVVVAAKRLGRSGRPWARAGAAGATLGGLFLVGRGLTGTNLTLGPGYDALRWALDPGRDAWLIVALATLRVAATAASLAGGAVGGLFIPLVLQGALVGRLASAAVGPANPTLFPVVGIAAYLGAGYRVPLAAVVFVAEFTGRPGFVVPGLIAAVVAQLVMGRASVEAHQRKARLGQLERRLRLPLAGAVVPVPTVGPAAAVAGLGADLARRGGPAAVAVVDGSRFLGLVTAAAVAASPPGATAASALRADLPVARPDWTRAEAVRAMAASGAEVLAVCDGGRLVGVVAAADLVPLAAVVELAEGDDG